MVNSILSVVGTIMTALKIPTLMGQGIIAVIEFLLTAGQFFIGLFTKAFGFIF